MVGTVSSLGVGSGLELQSILDQLKEVDQEVVDRKRNDIVELEAQLEEFTVVKNKLFTMKSSALGLSLSSEFLGRTVTSSSEDVLSATVLDGAALEANVIVVTNLAAKSSWMSDSGYSSITSSVYVPTVQESETGTTAATSTSGYITVDDSITITYGDADPAKTITVAVTNGMSMDDVVSAINLDAENDDGLGGTYVTAETFVADGENFLRIKSTAGGSGESERVMITEGFSDVSMAPPDKEISFQVGSGTAITVTVAADTTLTGLVGLINDDIDNPGVTASIINDGVDSANPYKFVLQADESGEDNRISFLQQLPDLNISENADQAVADSLNAQFTVDGINYQRQTNSVNDILSGVTFDIKSVGTSTLSVANNDETLIEKITSFVEAYNDVTQEISQKASYDSETEEFGMLSRTTLRDLPFELRNLMTTSITADEEGKVTTMFDLGLEFGREGIITINQKTLEAAVKDNRDGVAAFFLGDSDKDITGFADKVNERLRYLTSDQGIVEGEKEAAKTRISGLEDSIERQTERLNKKYANLTKQFVQLDRYMSQMTSMADYLSGQFDSIAGLASNVNKSK